MMAARTSNQLPPRVDFGVPASVAPVKASQPPSGGRYSCGALGACQGHDPCCLLVVDPLVCPDSPASPVRDSERDDVSPTAFEEVTTWVLFAVLAALTTAVTLGSAGFLYAVWVAP